MIYLLLTLPLAVLFILLLIAYLFLKSEEKSMEGY